MRGVPGLGLIVALEITLFRTARPDRTRRHARLGVDRLDVLEELPELAAVRLTAELSRVRIFDCLISCSLCWFQTQIRCPVSGIVSSAAGEWSEARSVGDGGVHVSPLSSETDWYSRPSHVRMNIRSLPGAISVTAGS